MSCVVSSAFNTTNTTFDDTLMAGHFDLKVFVNCLQEKSEVEVEMFSHLSIIKSCVIAH